MSGLVDSAPGLELIEESMVDAEAEDEGAKAALPRRGVQRDLRV